MEGVLLMAAESTLYGIEGRPQLHSYLQCS